MEDAVRRDSSDHAVLDFAEVNAPVSANRESGRRPHDQRRCNDPIRKGCGGRPGILARSCIAVDDEAVEVVDALNPPVAAIHGLVPYVENVVAGDRPGAQARRLVVPTTDGGRGRRANVEDTRVGSYAPPGDHRSCPRGLRPGLQKRVVHQPAVSDARVQVAGPDGHRLLALELAPIDVSAVPFERPDGGQVQGDAERRSGRALTGDADGDR